MKLRQIAHSRSGDKGDISNLSLILFDPAYYEWVRQHVTAERLARHFHGIVAGKIERYELKELHAFNFVMTNALGGGVLRSLCLDTHGKSLSSVLLDLEIPEPESVCQ